MHDPYLTLGVSREATDDEIRRAYLAAIHRCPPEQDAERFQAIRAAYETLRSEKSRLEYMLFNTDLPTPDDLIERLAKGGGPGRPGIDLFRELLRGGPHRGRK